VDAESEVTIEFTKDQQEEVMRWLVDFLIPFSQNLVIPVTGLAVVGAACPNCPFRHVCSAYLSEAPELWTTNTAEKLPLDTWGTVERISRASQGDWELLLLDAANRTVKVFGLAQARITGLNLGDRIWLFGLRSLDQRGTQHAWRHPRNFFEYSEADRFARAWNLAVFREPHASIVEGSP
jgi:hypothetical protein